MRNKLLHPFLLLTVLASIPSALPALPVISLIPPGLSPGATYQLIFVTPDSFPATSANIADYNNFINTEVAADPALVAFDAEFGVTWTAIGSTSSITASVNAPSTGSVYTVTGVLIADSAQPLYGDNLLATPTVDDYGNYVQNWVWTGDTGGGGTASGYELGSANPAFGYTNYTSRAWEYYASGFEGPPSTLYQMYALSSVITVTPEPPALVLGLACCALLILLRIVKRLKQDLPGTNYEQ